MKNDKLCFNKPVAIIIAVVIALVVFTAGAAQLSQMSTSTSSRASSCAPGKNIGSGFYQCEGNCGFTTGGNCPKYVHNSKDSSCGECNGVIQTTTAETNATQPSPSASTLVQMMVWNQSTMTQVRVNNNAVILNDRDVYQVCLSYVGIGGKVKNAYILPDVNKSIFSVGAASSLISRNSSSNKTFGCTSVTTMSESSSPNKKIVLSGSLVLEDDTVLKPENLFVTASTQTTITQTSSTQATSSFSKTVEFLMWNETANSPVTINNNAVITSNDVYTYQVCLSYKGNGRVRDAYILPAISDTKSVFYVNPASSLISRNSNSGKIFGCTSVADISSSIPNNGRSRKIVLEGSVILENNSSTVPGEVLSPEALTITAP